MFSLCIENNVKLDIDILFTIFIFLIKMSPLGVEDIVDKNSDMLGSNVNLSTGIPLYHLYSLIKMSPLV